MNNLVEGLIRIFLLLPVFVPAIVLHEYAHAWAADRLGDPTARLMGRLTLDPKVHFDPFGALVFVLTSLAGRAFGWARPVPVNYANLRNPVKDMIWVAAAGPAANVVQAVVWYVAYWLVALVLPAPSGDFLGFPGAVLEVLYFLPAHGVLLNLILMAFNLIPLPPLDGSRILAGLLPYEQRRAFQSLESAGMILLMVLLYTGWFGKLTQPLYGLWVRLIIWPFM